VFAKERKGDMKMGKGGINCNMFNDNEILLVDSPKTGERTIGGPYMVVTKDLEKRSAIVAMLDLAKQPCLGQHIFSGNNGTPTALGHPVWEFIGKTEELEILSSLDQKAKEIFADFLNDKEDRITGEELAVIGSIKAICSLHNINEQKTLNLCYMCYRKFKKAQDAESKKKERRKVKEKLKETEKRLNQSTAISSKHEIFQDFEEFLEGISP
jgi:transposase-like protein